MFAKPKTYNGRNLTQALEWLRMANHEAAAMCIWEDVGDGSPYLCDDNDYDRGGNNIPEIIRKHGGNKLPEMPYAWTLRKVDDGIRYLCHTEQTTELDDIEL